MITELAALAHKTVRRAAPAPAIPQLARAHALPPDEVIARLRSSEHGLTSDDARQRLAQLGPNVIAEETPPSRLALLAGQVANLPNALQVLLTYPFTDQVLKDIKGDYLNAYLSIKAAPGTTVIAPVSPRASIRMSGAMSCIAQTVCGRGERVRKLTVRARGAGCQATTVRAGPETGRR